MASGFGVRGLGLKPMWILVRLAQMEGLMGLGKGPRRELCRGGRIGANRLGRRVSWGSRFCLVRDLADFQGWEEK